MSESTLIELLPQTLLASLQGLPKRLLYQNEHAQVLLVGLRRGQKLAEFHPPLPLLMLVACGRVAVEEAASTFELAGGEEHSLGGELVCQFQALEDSDLLFFVSTPSPHARQRATFELLSERSRSAQKRNKRSEPPGASFSMVERDSIDL